MLSSINKYTCKHTAKLWVQCWNSCEISKMIYSANRSIQYIKFNLPCLIVFLINASWQLLIIIISSDVCLLFWNERLFKSNALPKRRSSLPFSLNEKKSYKLNANVESGISKWVQYWHWSVGEYFLSRTLRLICKNQKKKMKRSQGTISRLLQSKNAKRSWSTRLCPRRRSRKQSMCPFLWNLQA